MNLSPQQLDCVNYGGSTLMVVAIPGSGKTRTLAHAIAARIGRIPANRILALTFTRLAAREMRNRLVELVGGSQAAGLTIGTFHAVCYELLRQNWQSLGFSSPEIAVYSREEQRRLVKEIIFTSRHNATQGAILGAIEGLGRGVTLDQLAKQVPKNVFNLLQIYLRTLREHNAVDYPLVPHEARRLLDSESVTCWSDIFVDEYQDLDAQQYDILHRLVSRVGGRLFFVGDPDQQIFGWRGASVELMRTAATRFGATIRLLDHNYRSAEPIVAMANSLIAHNVDRVPKVMVCAEKIEGEAMVIDEAELVQDVDRALKDHETCAILARTHDDLERLAHMLALVGIEHSLVGRRDKILEREQVKIALAYLSWQDCPLSPLVLQRVLLAEGRSDLDIEEVRAQGRSTGEGFFKVGLQRYPALAQFYSELDGQGIIERVALIFHRLRTLRAGLVPEDQQELIKALTQFVRYEPFVNRTPGRFAAWLSLRDGQDEVRVTDRLQLLTMHACKGLEFSAVWITGMEDSKIPHRRSHTPAGIEDERRLLFVAMTRAQRRLVLCRPAENPSRFFDELTTR